MITEDALKEMHAKHEAEMAELGKQMQFHQQQVAVCERNMIHKAGQMDAIKKMLGNAEIAGTPAGAAEQPAPARSARKR